MSRFGGSKGLSTVVGTIFLVITVLGIFSSIFLWTITQNTLYNQAVKESHQMDADRFSERITTSRANFTLYKPGTVQVDVTLSNEGPVSAQVITAWVVRAVGGETRYGFNDTLNISLNPGETLNQVPIRVDIADVSSTGALSGWLITARGNMISLEKEKSFITAEVAQGIGSVSMDFATFKYHEAQGNVLKDYQPLPPDPNLDRWNSGFKVPAGQEIVFAIHLTNLDIDERTIVLNSSSLLWVYYPDMAASDVWNIVDVDLSDGTISPLLSPITLAFEDHCWIFFGPTKTSFKGRSGAVNLLLIGQMEGIEKTDEYGQNIPFVSIRVTD